AAVVHVRPGAADLAQAGHTELAEIAMLCLDVARADACGTGSIVAVPAELVERAALQPRDAGMTAAVDLARPHEKRNAGVAELAVGEEWTEVTGRAVGAEKELE